MNKYVFLLIILVALITTSLLSAPVNAQQSTTQRDSTYRDRLIDYADIYSYELDTNSKDTLLYVRKINDYWYGLFGTANFGLSFGDFKGMVDPNNDHNIFNTIVDFYSQFGQGYTLGLVGEWIPNKSDWGLGLKLGLYDKKITHVGSENVEIPDYFGGKYDFSANITYFNVAPFVKYSIPFFDGFFLTGGVDLSIAYSTVALMERNFAYTGEIYHRIPINDAKGSTRFLLNLGAGYDFFIADFFSQKNRVRITPFAEIKGGTKVISSGGSSWNDLVLNVGLQIKLAPDIVSVDTLIYDPNSEIPVEYFADLRNDEEGVEFAGIDPRLSTPPSFNLEIVRLPIDSQTVAVTAPKPDTVVKVAVNVPSRQTRPTTSRRPTQPDRPFFVGNDTTVDIGGYTSSRSTTLTQSMRDDLDRLIKFMKENPNARIRLDGHSDNRGGSAQANMTNSRNRARVMRTYLINQGIAPGRVLFQGRGALDPVATNDTEPGRRQNRRVEVILLR